jgi:hypothetical protein
LKRTNNGKNNSRSLRDDNKKDSCKNNRNGKNDGNDKRRLGKFVHSHLRGMKPRLTGNSFQLRTSETTGAVARLKILWSM